MQTRHTSPDQLTKWDFVSPLSGSSNEFSGSWLDQRIYCDQKRLKLRVKDPGHYYDPGAYVLLTVAVKPFIDPCD